ncbi:Bug family tripartite tricarboxylate transporter substrate binding protein [Roseococcus pinisoli]|uniref:Tripartite tricarboxylate transporter substrate binding protein n=1 Tax=Roseococcus pinisoli TaxID=2835040 RepID=A0ABS5QIZ9_9PROT|nr:tripartite tricarboxylate transporter substrate binding protein [Roseococcus pinisoli]MBS7813657.1 tripartite tricarboxylate transporter substrate binding protein [Roseococcus pinisoli]
MPMNRRHLLAAPALLPLLPLGAAASAYPDRPLRYVVPFQAGAMNDLLARHVARDLTARLGQPVVVENRVGAGGALGTQYVTQQRADGYTLLNSTSGVLCIVPHIIDAPFDPFRDFTPVGFPGEGFTVLAVHPSVPVNSVEELVAYARAHPGKLNFGSAGHGSFGHIQGELFKQLAEIDAVHVPFPGSAGALNSAIAGDTQFIFDAYALQHAQAGRLRALAITGPGRWEAAPDLPNVKEVGLANWPVNPWWTILVRSSTPPEIVATLNRSLNEAFEDRSLLDPLKTLGLRPERLSPEQIQEKVRHDHAVYGALVRRIGLSSRS